MILPLHYIIILAHFYFVLSPIMVSYTYLSLPKLYTITLIFPPRTTETLIRNFCNQCEIYIYFKYRCQMLDYPEIIILLQDCFEFQK